MPNRNTISLGFVWLPILLVILGVAVVGGGSYYVMHQSVAPVVPIYQEATTTPAATQATTKQAVQPTNTPHDADFSASPITGSAPLTTRFTLKGKATHFYTFSFGDGTEFSVRASNDFDNVSCTAAGPDSVCSGTHSYTTPGVYAAKITDSSNTVLGTATITVTAPATSVSATISPISNSSAPTISGTLQNMNGKGDLSIVIVKNSQTLPAQTANPATLSDVAAYSTSGLDGDINTDYKTSYSYVVSPTLKPGTYTIGIYLNTLFVQDSAFHGFQLLASKSFTISN